MTEKFRMNSKSFSRIWSWRLAFLVSLVLASFAMQDRHLGVRGRM